MLPRQVIHRDLHTANMLFDGDKFSGWLDLAAQALARDFPRRTAAFFSKNGQAKTSKGCLHMAKWLHRHRGILHARNIF